MANHRPTLENGQIFKAILSNLKEFNMEKIQIHTVGLEDRNKFAWLTIPNLKYALHE